MQAPTTLRKATRAALGTLAALAAAGLVLLGAPAWAHVSIDPGTATQGGYAALTFRVPNESDATSTTKVQVFLPQDHPLASVSVKPHPGWHAKVATEKLATPLRTDDGEVTEGVTSITWTSDTRGDAIGPGEYDEFDLSVGPLPEVSSLTFKTLQTYSDGTVVRWIDLPPAAGEPEPEHLAPTLTLLPASSDQEAGDGATTGDGDRDGADGADGGSGTATTALALSIVAVLLGAGALGTSLLRRRT
jgi:uncharacterized protein YcnI